ncbi:MAG: hypothetical protein V4506_03700 [Bacteroidota bacterium]
MSNKLKILIASVSGIVFIFLVGLLTDLYLFGDLEYVIILFIGLFIVGLFIKSNPKYTVIGWSMVWIFLFYVSIALFLILFLLTYGPHGVC